MYDAVMGRAVGADIFIATAAVAITAGAANRNTRSRNSGNHDLTLERNPDIL